jgi:Asp-tRNA(Asn)/Glu-tRNA(Gln) amidotransferase A subunit family amidase
VDASQLNWLSATDAARAIREGAISAEQLTEACLARVRDADREVEAWTYLDPEHALKQARARDQDRRQGQPVGPLHGVPVGVKDIFDTSDMPTEDGSVLHAGRTPEHDATAVALLRAARDCCFG